jgi:hypothetical protein
MTGGRNVMHFGQHRRRRQDHVALLRLKKQEKLELNRRAGRYVKSCNQLFPCGPRWPFLHDGRRGKENPQRPRRTNHGAAAPGLREKVTLHPAYWCAINRAVNHARMR